MKKKEKKKDKKTRKKITSKYIKYTSGFFVPSKKDIPRIHVF